MHLDRTCTHPVAAGILQHRDQPRRRGRSDEVPRDLAAVRCQLACKAHPDKTLAMITARAMPKDCRSGLGLSVAPRRFRQAECSLEEGSTLQTVL